MYEREIPGLERPRRPFHVVRALSRGCMTSLREVFRARERRFALAGQVQGPLMEQSDALPITARAPACFALPALLRVALLLSVCLVPIVLRWLALSSCGNGVSCVDLRSMLVSRNAIRLPSLSASTSWLCPCCLGLSNVCIICICIRVASSTTWSWSAAEMY